MLSQYPTMHRHSELEEDLRYSGVLPEEILFKWFNDRYSTSKHLLTLYSIARGLNAKTILEIGFGRSSFVLAKAAKENGGRFITCDRDDYSYLLNKEEKKVTQFVHGNSELVWPIIDNEGIEFAFLDYFSSDALSEQFVFNQFYQCFNRLKQNGVICIHDSIISEYKVETFLKKVKTKTRGLRINKELEIVSLPYNYGLAIIRKLSPSHYGIIKDGFEKK